VSPPPFTALLSTLSPSSQLFLIVGLAIGLGGSVIFAEFTVAPSSLPYERKFQRGGKSPNYLVLGWTLEPLIISPSCPLFQPVFPFIIPSPPRIAVGELLCTCRTLLEASAWDIRDTI
jgi:hypothetical protein